MAEELGDVRLRIRAHHGRTKGDVRVGKLGATARVLGEIFCQGSGGCNGRIGQIWQCEDAAGRHIFSPFRRGVSLCEPESTPPNIFANVRLPVFCLTFANRGCSCMAEYQWLYCVKRKHVLSQHLVLCQLIKKLARD